MFPILALALSLLPKPSCLFTAQLAIDGLVEIKDKTLLREKQ